MLAVFPMFRMWKRQQCQLWSKNVDHKVYKLFALNYQAFIINPILKKCKTEIKAVYNHLQIRCAHDNIGQSDKVFPELML